MDKTAGVEAPKPAARRPPQGEAFTVGCLSEGGSRNWRHK
jgi:hypothetical protein